MKNLANLRRQSKKDAVVVGRFMPNARCKKHPKHLQSPGVCSLCLRERLARLTAASGSCTKPAVVADEGSSCSSSVSSISSHYSSASASSCASPIRPYRFAKGSARSIFLFNGKHVLTKSKSVAAVVEQEGSDQKKKKPGFWFMLLRPKSNRSMDGQNSQPLTHTRALTIIDTLQQPVDG